MGLNLWSSSANFEQIYRNFAWICVAWYILVWFVCAVGYCEIRRRYSKSLPEQKPIPAERLPFISILRPIKGVDPHLALTLRSTFHIDYPVARHEIVFCIASPLDPAIPVVRSLIAQYPESNAKLLIAEENVGTNPKIRTLSKAYKGAQGDIVWVVDSNIWLPPGILERSVRDLCGLDENGNKTKKGYKLLHHLPVAVNTESEEADVLELEHKPSHVKKSVSLLSDITDTFGGTLEETFLSTSHSKFYTAINILDVAPCALGKSTMWRRSHLAAITPPESSGIVYFAPYICEDHMLGAHIYNKRLPQETRVYEGPKEEWGRHIMGTDLVYQPLSSMKVKDYIGRRIRWIRVRKFAVIAATLVEPNTESVLCNLWGSYGVVTLMERYGWTSFDAFPKLAQMAFFWILGMAVWSYFDYHNFKVLHSFAGVSDCRTLPKFIAKKGRKWESPLGWASQWIAREFLAFPIWLSAMLSDEISWRGEKYVILWDMTSREVKDTEPEEPDKPRQRQVSDQSHSRPKARSGKGKKRSAGVGSSHQRRLSLKLL